MLDLRRVRVWEVLGAFRRRVPGLRRSVAAVATGAVGRQRGPALGDRRITWGAPMAAIAAMAVALAAVVLVFVIGTPFQPTGAVEGAVGTPATVPTASTAQANQCRPRSRSQGPRPRSRPAIHRPPARRSRAGMAPRPCLRPVRHRHPRPRRLQRALRRRPQRPRRHRARPRRRRPGRHHARRRRPHRARRHTRTDAGADPESDARAHRNPDASADALRATGAPAGRSAQEQRRDDLERSRLHGHGNGSARRWKLPHRFAGPGRRAAVPVRLVGHRRALTLPGGDSPIDRRPAAVEIDLGVSGHVSDSCYFLCRSQE